MRQHAVRALLMGAMVVGLSVSALAVLHQAPIDLGTGWSAADINDAGQIAGTKDGRPVLWQNGIFTYLDAAGGASKLNNLGQVVGTVNVNGANHASLWNGKQWQDLHEDLNQWLGATSSGAIKFNNYDFLGGGAIAINNYGWVTGGYVDSAGRQRAFLWRPDSIPVDLGVLSGGAQAWATDINDSGQVSGYAEEFRDDLGMNPRALRWQNGVMTPLSAGFLPDAGPGSFGLAINERGWVVGYDLCCPIYYAPHVGMNSPVVWYGPDQEVSLGIQMTYASDINNAGLIVGSSNDSSLPYQRRPWTNSEYYLPQLPWYTPGEHWWPQYGEATAVNNLGQIVGFLDPGDGTDHVVLWNPVPEPSSLLALGSGLAGLGGLCLRRRRR